MFPIAETVLPSYSTVIRAVQNNCQGSWTDNFPRDATFLVLVILILDIKVYLNKARSSNLKKTKTQSEYNEIKDIHEDDFEVSI